MSVEPRLSDLLLAWEDARTRGKDPSPEELCRDCPELTPALQQHIRALKSLNPVLDLTPYHDEAAAAETVTAPTELGNLAGYDLLEELGRGGTGMVYKARQTGLDRVVAIKMLLGGHFAGQIALRRFRTEAQTLAQLRHPHIVQIHDIGSHQGSPYFVLEYLDGGDLSQLLDGKPLDPVEAARLVEVLARTVHTVHQAGIIHRDLKPGNVLLQKVDPLPATKPMGAVQLRGQWFVPKLTDFGLARAAESQRQLTVTGVAIGTPVFMAPEQAQGKKSQIGPPTDVYSLGVLMYQLLTGTFPFGTDAAWQTMQHVLTRRPEPPSRRNPACPRDLEAICLRCLEKEPRRRYPTAERLADDLRCFLDGLPVSACRPWWARLSRRGWVNAAVAGVLALVGLAALGLWYANREDGAPTLPPAGDQHVFTIGVVTAQNGPGSQHAQSIRDGVRLAVKELNEQEGPYRFQVAEFSWPPDPGQAA